MSFWPARNPVAYAWFHARGGLRVHGGVAVLGTAAGLALLWLSSWEMSPAVTGGWAVAMLMLLGVLSVLVGGLGVAGALRADVGGDGGSAWWAGGVGGGGGPGSGGGGGMHDSLRLMDLSPASVMFGYVLGASSQALCAIVPCTVVGVVASYAADASLLLWFRAAGLLLMTAVATWAATALLAMLTRQAGVILVVLVVVSPLLLGVMSFVPAISVLLPPLAGASAFDVRSLDVGAEVVVAALVQFVLAGVLFFAAARKFSQPHRHALGVDLGLCLLAVWSVANALGLLLWESMGPRWLDDLSAGRGRLVGGASLTLLLFALAPLTSLAARLGTARRVQRRLGIVPRDTPPSWMTLCVAAAAVTLGLLPVAAAFPELEVEFGLEGALMRAAAAGAAWAAFAAALLQLGMVAHSRLATRGRLAVALGVAGLMILPLLGELTVQLLVFSAAPFERSTPLGWMSPAAVLWGLFVSTELPWVAIAGGLTLQVLTAVVLRFGVLPSGDGRAEVASTSA
ncbi:MAG: hypothetical protein ACK4PI_04680 [Tepidisphaerales bacterium]